MPTAPSISRNAALNTAKLLEETSELGLVISEELLSAITDEAADEVVASLLELAKGDELIIDSLLEIPSDERVTSEEEVSDKLEGAATSDELSAKLLSDEAFEFDD